MPDVPIDERSERLTDEELESFHAYADRNMHGPTGDRSRWADYTVRLIEEVLHLREIEEALQSGTVHEDDGDWHLVLRFSGNAAVCLRTALEADTGGQDDVGDHAVSLIREYHPGVPGYICIPWCKCGWRDVMGWTDEENAEKRARRHERLAADPHTEEAADE